VVGICAAAGFDFVLPDLEHTGASLREIEGVVRAADAAGIIPTARVPGCTKPDILPALEAGVRAIMIPSVETVEEAQSVVAAARYAPEGRRGVYYLGYGSAYCGTPPVEYFQATNEQLLIVLQIETVQGVANAREIAAVPGVDCLFIGPGDLSASLGVAWQFEHSTMWEAIRGTFEAARSHGKIAGIMPPTADYARRCVDAGARMLLWGPDMAMFQRAAQEDVTALSRTLGWQPARPASP
jgi:2-keto-3-deoxy-L-rhamnonate aldolase RhmA